MQLLSIRIVKLNLVLITVLDRFWREIPTYDTKGVASLDHTWTGLRGSLCRGNDEELDWSSGSYMDTMRILLKAHIIFPYICLDNS